jgi:small-conductance mechanosensitive channel
MTELDKLDELLEKEQKTNKDLSLKLIQQNDELIQAKSDNESINNELNYTYDELDKCKEQYEGMIE